MDRALVPAIGGAAIMMLFGVAAVVGAAWLADVVVRTVSVFLDGVAVREAITVLAIGSLLGAAILSGYWAA